MIVGNINKRLFFKRFLYRLTIFVKVVYIGIACTPTFTAKAEMCRHHRALSVVKLLIRLSEKDTRSFYPIRSVTRIIISSPLSLSQKSFSVNN